MNTKELKNRLLTKKDFESFFKNHHHHDFKRVSIKELREIYGVTHLINDKFKDMRGNCFMCLTPLRADYMAYENYCKDCE